MSDDITDDTTDNTINHVTKDTLLVFDLNGTLILRKKNRNGYKIVKRNGLIDFLSDCFNNYDVAIFTSMLKINMDNALCTILKSEQLDKLVFKWDRDYTDRDPKGNNSWSTTKSIKKIQDHLESIGRKYKNILIIDDDYNKLRHNPVENIIICKSFILNEDEKNMLKDLQIIIKNKIPKK